jgi:hypothetical protein
VICPKGAMNQVKSSGSPDGLIAASELKKANEIKGSGAATTSTALIRRKISDLREGLMYRASSHEAIANTLAIA